MEHEVVFKFESNGEQIIMDGRGREFGIVDYEGIESTDYELIAEQNLNGKGASLKKRKALFRQITVEFEARSTKDVSAKRQKLISFFSLYRPGTLTVTFLGVTRSIDYEVSSFKIKSKNIHEKLSCLLVLKCMKPEFLSEFTVGERIMTLIGGWKWKFTLPFRMKQYGPLKKSIYLAGDLETPVEIYFKGPAENPVVKNHRTGEYIKVNRALTTDETLYISTEYKKKKVEIIRGNIREDAWDALDFSSKFFWLYPGDNMIEYSMDGEPEKTRGVEIYYRERYLGI